MSTNEKTNPEEVQNVAENHKKVLLFRDIDPDDPEPEATEIESACMNCFATGTTRLLLTKIPFFKEIVLMSFKCEKCGFENNEIQSASEIQSKGIRMVLHVKSVNDINRRVVKSDYTSVQIPEVELEIPSQSQKGEINTVEGIIDRTIQGLTQDQEKRRVEHPDAAKAIDLYIEKLNKLKEVNEPFTVILEDISGNSFIENPRAPAIDLNCATTHFVRTKEQDHLLGIYRPEELATDDDEKPSEEKYLLKPIAEDVWPLEELEGEVLRFATNCPHCRSPCETNMKMTNIPHFKEVVIMATLCEVCGLKTNEVKSGGGIEEKGIRFKIEIESPEDLSRDILKSETCSLTIPELELEVGPSALGGRFTTVEGIIAAMKEQLQSDGVMFKDSADESANSNLTSFLQKLDEIMQLKRKVVMTLDDPAGNSYVQSLADGDEPDSKLTIEKYERTFEENEELGLNDMKIENY